jgi:hypothetical protein
LQVIIDDYREKLRGLSPTEALEQVRRLETAVSQLQKRQWRQINSVQRARFLEILRNMKLDNNFIELFVVTGDAEASSYVMQLSKLLRDAGFICGSDGIVRDREFVDFDKFGLVVLVKKADALSLNAQWLVQGLKYSDFEYHLTSVRVVPHAREDYLALRVGPKPALE